MEQVPIEEILAEFREKYNYREINAEPKEKNDKNDKYDKQDKTPKFVSFSGTENPPLMRRNVRGSLGFMKIIAVQGITAAVIIAAVIAVRLFNTEMYETIAEFLRNNL
jgi:RNase P/RNase MRP subunit p30